MAFITKINLQDNRQHYLPYIEKHLLSGTTVFGQPFSAMTSGPDLSDSGTTGSIINIISTFSGNTGTTVFNFGHPDMDIAQNSFNTITPSNSATTQNSGDVWVGNNYQVIDGNLSYLDYSGTSFDINVTSMVEVSPNTYTGTVLSDDVFWLSAGTLDFTGRTIWSDVIGIHRTEKIIISDNPIDGGVLTSDADGMASWQLPVSSSGTSTIWEYGVGLSESSIKNINGSHIFNGGVSKSLIGGGINNSIGKCSNSAIIGGSGNVIDAGNNSVILGGNNITGTSRDMVYVPDLIIDGLVSTDPLATDINGKIIAGASDGRLKQNVNDLTDSLNKVRKLRGVSYEWTEESNMGKGVRYGLIAQEVNEVLPDMVRLRAKGDGMLTLNYTEVVPWLIEAIKELSNPNYVNTELQTQTIIAEDNSIELNYGGNHLTSVGGGIIVKDGSKDGVDSYMITDDNGNWNIGPSLHVDKLSISSYKPMNSNDIGGNIGDITWCDDFIYLKTNNGWKRTELKTF